MVEPVNNFETNTGSFKPGRAAALADFHSGRSGKAATRNAKRTLVNAEAREARISVSAKKAKRVDLGLPTPERLAKGDVVKGAGGHYRAPPPIERLRDREKLSPGDAYTNEALYRAAERLNDLFLGSGLSAGAQAQDLSRVVSGGGDPASGMPLNEHAAAQRKELRIALKLMGWFDAYPHRGASRLTLDVVCFEIGVEDAARKHRPGGNDTARMGVGMDVLREGLFALAVHWRILRA